jgi:hypothetical protein
MASPQAVVIIRERSQSCIRRRSKDLMLPQKVRRKHHCYSSGMAQAATKNSAAAMGGEQQPPQERVYYQSKSRNSIRFLIVPFRSLASRSAFSAWMMEGENRYH